MSGESVELPRSTRAFYAGVTDAEAVNNLWSVAGMPDPAGDPNGLALWWWYMGRTSAEADHGLVDQETQVEYLRGVMLRSPAAVAPEPVPCACWGGVCLPTTECPAERQ